MDGGNGKLEYAKIGCARLVVRESYKRGAGRVPVGGAGSLSRSQFLYT